MVDKIGIPSGEQYLGVLFGVKCSFTSVPSIHDLPLYCPMETGTKIKTMVLGYLGWVDPIHERGKAREKREKRKSHLLSSLATVLQLNFRLQKKKDKKHKLESYSYSEVKKRKKKKKSHLTKLPN
ncbi:hypothetical protein L873DRAFT_973042 [Choiromyces venosus 120613-1]|uniref:Uncharacterized protein n=1 Tax=Choiromyces venosus 120613-1 TaxID=1336337 RepID=A0A3N4JPV8_9PEZI|nr:hypothetical protein L873DRAFT_973042 [Choiromyces venosus 120613-1]